MDLKVSIMHNFFITLAVGLIGGILLAIFDITFTVIKEFNNSYDLSSLFDLSAIIFGLYMLLAVLVMVILGNFYDQVELRLILFKVFRYRQQSLQCLRYP